MIHPEASIEECMQEISALEAEIAQLEAERKNCPPVSESEYVRRLEDEIERLEAIIARTLPFLQQYCAGMDSGPNRAVLRELIKQVKGEE